MTDLDITFQQLTEELNKMESDLDKDLAEFRLRDTIRQYKGEDRLISSLEILERIKTQPEEEKFLTGIEGLDNILKGFRKNQLIIVAAPTKSGKTQFCIDLTVRMAKTDPVWIPFEESAEELIRKFHERGEVPPLFYTPNVITGNTVDWIEKKVIEGKVKFGSTLFFIDHLHFIVPMTSDRLDTRIGDTMRKLKTIAKKNGVIIVLIAHLKKTNMSVSPTLEDLRDSSFIAQEADTVLMLWRKAKRNDDGDMEITNDTLLSVQANRRTGSTGNVKLTFDNGHYLEKDWKHKEQENW